MAIVGIYVRFLGCTMVKTPGSEETEVEGRAFLMISACLPCEIVEPCWLLYHNYSVHTVPTAHITYQMGVMPRCSNYLLFTFPRSQKRQTYPQFAKEIYS